jgi:putative transposase
MTKIRKQYSDQFKFKVALEAVKGLATINEIASRFQVHPNQVRNWKKKLVDDGPMVFEGKSGKHHQNLSTQEAELYEQIGPTSHLRDGVLPEVISGTTPVFDIGDYIPQE